MFSVIGKIIGGFLVLIILISIIAIDFTSIINWIITLIIAYYFRTSLTYTLGTIFLFNLFTD